MALVKETSSGLKIFIGFLSFIILGLSVVVGLMAGGLIGVDSRNDHPGYKIYNFTKPDLGNDGRVKLLDNLPEGAHLKNGSFKLDGEGTDTYKLVVDTLILRDYSANFTATGATEVEIKPDHEIISTQGIVTKSGASLYIQKVGGTASARTMTIKLAINSILELPEQETQSS